MWKNNQSGVWKLKNTSSVIAMLVMLGLAACKAEEVQVVVAGVVMSPGHYKISRDAKIAELIDLAGGVNTDFVANEKKVKYANVWRGAEHWTVENIEWSAGDLPFMPWRDGDKIEFLLPPK